MIPPYDKPLVVVFGGGGYVGSWITRELLSAGFHVRVFDSFLFGRDGVDDLKHPNLEIIEDDIKDVVSVSKAMKGAESVVLLSSLIGKRFLNIYQEDMRDINFLSSSVVLDASIEHGVNRFIFISSDCVYGYQQGVIYETLTPEPVSLYSRLKLRMEERVINKKSREFHPVALRLATCYGYSPRMRFDLICNSLIRDAVCKKKIVVDSQESCRAFIHVQDMARATLSALKAHPNLISGEVFNIGNKHETFSIKHIVSIIASICPSIEIEFKNKVPDLTNYQLSYSKMERLLDFFPRWEMKQSLINLKLMLEDKRIKDPYNPKYQNRENY